VYEPLGVCFTPFPIVEEDPLVLSFYPPELSPDRVLLLARTIQCGHLNISLPAHPWAIVILATNYSILLLLVLLCAVLDTAAYLQGKGQIPSTQKPQPSYLLDCLDDLHKGRGSSRKFRAIEREGGGQLRSAPPFFL
jgi:hypothetical protein